MEEGNYKVEVPSMYSFSTNEDDYFEAGDSRRTTERFDFNSSFLIDKSKGFVTFKNEHHCKFSWRYFVEFFTYHFMFYFVLGPLFPLVFLPITGVSLMRNMGFWGLRYPLFIQLGNWLLIVLVVGIVIINPHWNQGERPIVSIIDVYSVIVLTLLRISNISSKYATYTPEKLAYLRHNVATGRELMWDQLFGDWLGQSDEKIIEEIESAVKRNEIDLNLLMVYFLRPPDQATLDRLMSKNTNFRNRNKTLFQRDQEMGERNNSITRPEQNPDEHEEGKHQIFGVAIIHDLLERFRENKNFRKLMILCIVVSLARGAIPWFSFRTTGLLGCWETWVIALFLSFGISFIYFQTTVFFALADVDTSRKIFLETQLGYMITPRKYGGTEGEKKIFPTTNFLCPRHLRGWNLLRKIGRDYGYKYSLREANNLGWAAVLFFLLAILLALDFFKIIEIGKWINGAATYTSFQLIVLFDVLCFFTLLMRELVLGIKLNKFYKIHKNNFEEMQIFISDIARKTEWYFNKNLTPKNYLYSFIVDHFKSECRNSRGLSVNKRLEDLLSTMKEINRDLQFEETHRPFTVLGFEPSTYLLRTIGIGVASLTFAITQYAIRQAK